MISWGEWYIKFLSDCLKLKRLNFKQWIIFHNAERGKNILLPLPPPIPPRPSSILWPEAKASDVIEHMFGKW